MFDPLVPCKKGISRRGDNSFCTLGWRKCGSDGRKGLLGNGASHSGRSASAEECEWGNDGADGTSGADEMRLVAFDGSGRQLKPGHGEVTSAGAEMECVNGMGSPRHESSSASKALHSQCRTIYPRRKDTQEKRLLGP